MKHFLPHIAFFAGILSAIYAEEAGPSPLAAAESLLVKQNYRKARGLVDRHLRKTPEDIYALYLRTAIAQTEILDYESYHLHSERFIRAADSVRSILKKRLSKLSGRDSTLCLFYIANIEGGIGVMKAKTGEWLSALRSSLKSVGMLKEVVRCDSSLCAAMLGIGIFHYYLSKNFGWLPFIDGDGEEEGIREIQKAAGAPLPYNFAAKNSLCWVLIDNEEYASADSVALSALNEVPGSTIFLRIRCLIALWSGRYDEALVLAKKLSEVSLVRDPVNWSDYVMSYYVMTGGYDGLGKGKEAIVAANYILGFKIPQEYRSLPPVKKNIKRILAIKNKY